MNVGRTHTDEWKKKASERLCGEGNPYFGRKHGDDIRKRISNRVRETFQNDPSILKRAHETLKEKFVGSGNPFFGRQHTDETRQKMSEARTRAISEGRLTCGPRGRKGSYTSIKTGVVERYDSFFELLRMKMLDADASVVSWSKKHNIRIEYEWNGHRRYVPDFFVHEISGTFVEEIKGYEDAEKLAAKLVSLESYCREHGHRVRYLNAESLDAMVRVQFGESIASLRRKS